MSKRLFVVALCAAAFFCAWGQARDPAIATASSEIPAFDFSPHLDLSADPIQRSVSGVPSVRVGGYVVTPVASFQVAGRVLGAKRYRSDREADLSPVDLALGWGPMANEDVLAAIDISQGGRFYRWWADEFPIPHNEIAHHSANMHLVPANPYVAAQLMAVEQGQEVRFKGYLLQVQADDGWRWRSSMRRTDEGAGACEVVLVDTLETL